MGGGDQLFFFPLRVRAKEVRSDYNRKDASETKEGTYCQGSVWSATPKAIFDEGEVSVASLDPCPRAEDGP